MQLLDFIAAMLYIVRIIFNLVDLRPPLLILFCRLVFTYNQDTSDLALLAKKSYHLIIEYHRNEIKFYLDLKVRLCCWIWSVCFLFACLLLDPRLLHWDPMNSLLSVHPFVTAFLRISLLDFSNFLHDGTDP